jgi:hypothetical protein
MGSTNIKSKKSSGFAKRKRQTKRPLQRTGKHKKAAPHVRNLANLVSRDKGERRAIAIECAAAARAKRGAAPAAAPAAMAE